VERNRRGLYLPEERDRNKENCLRRFQQGSSGTQVRNITASTNLLGENLNYFYEFCSCAPTKCTQNWRFHETNTCVCCRRLLSVRLIYLTGWSVGNAVDLYSEDAVFESRPGYRLSWQVFCGFPQSLQAYVWIVPRSTKTASFPILSNSSVM
jgi:hypothetical protein